MAGSVVTTVSRNTQTNKTGIRRKKAILQSIDKCNERPDTDDKTRRMKNARLVEEHLPPLILTMVVLFCSGSLMVLSLRDYLLTGKNVGGAWDEALLEYTKSTQWYEGSKGWKSTQGGFSAVLPVTTDSNNMGGFFVRKLCGAAGVSIQIQKLMPLLFHEPGAQWKMGHFRTLLWTAVVANVAVGVFFAMYLAELKAAGVAELPLLIIAVVAIETFTILILMSLSPRATLGPAISMPPGKVPHSNPSNIVRNTVLLITTFFFIIACRDLFFPGYIMDWLPRDDIFLEWTNALLHSPPDGTSEAVDYGLAAPMYIGDKFVSQLCAVYILINCFYKYVASVGLTYKSDGSGLITARMMWKSQAVGSLLMFSVYRVFTPAAKSASYDLRWHLMMLTYETFIFGTFGFM